MSGASADFAAYEAMHATVRRMEAEVAPANKAALFEALAGAGKLGGKADYGFFNSEADTSAPYQHAAF